MEGIQVSTELTGSSNHISIIRVGGYIDTTTSSELERALDTLLKQKKYNIVVDLGNVDYISSAGWGIFISEIKSIRENNGDLKLVKMIPDVYEIFELLEFHHILDVYDTLEEAIEQFEAHPSGAPTGGDISIAPKMAAQGIKPPTPAPIEEPVAETTPASAPAAEVQTAPVDSAGSGIDTLPVDGKIAEIIKVDPILNTRGIKRKLATSEFGFENVGWFKVRSILKKLDLNSKEKRFRFAMQQKGN